MFVVVRFSPPPMALHQIDPYWIGMILNVRVLFLLEFFPNFQHIMLTIPLKMRFCREQLFENSVWIWTPWGCRSSPFPN